VSLSLGDGVSVTDADGPIDGEAVSTGGDSVTEGVPDSAGAEAEASGVVSGVASMVVVATAGGVGTEEGVAVDGPVDGVDTGWSADASGVGAAVSTGGGVAVEEGVAATEASLEGDGAAATDGDGVGVVVSTGEGVAADEGFSTTDGDGSVVVEA
jgi:hypothetical protein